MRKGSRCPGGGRLSAWAAGTARATWSIVAVDPGAREVGAAVAGCVAIDPKLILDKEGVILLKALAPDAGAGIAQADFNPEALRR